MEDRKIRNMKRKLEEKIWEIPVIDIHTHLNAINPSAKDLTDIIFYHHVGSELISSGMPPENIWKNELPQEVVSPELPPKERIKRSLPYFKNISNTTLYWFLKIILKDIFGVKGGEINEKNWEKVYKDVNLKLSTHGWSEYVLNTKCKISRSITVSNVFTVEPNKQFELASECPDFFMRCMKSTSPQEVLKSLEKIFEGEITKASIYKKYLINYFEKVFKRKVKAIGIWIPRQLIYEEVSENKMDSVIKTIKKGEDNMEIRNSFACYSIKNILDIIRESSVKVVQFFLGSDVHLPHRSLTVYSGILVRELCLFTNQYPDIKFDILNASEHYIHDTAIAAKHFPNIYVSGYWWHSLYPYYIKKTIQTRLEIVPFNKIIGFFSDAYHSEWCYPKLKMVKSILAEVLTEKIISGYYTEKMALSIASKILYTNPKELYEL
jgi:glucuronate isomerase